ncbi:autotransporter-associated beta strand repeat-containing protein/T5SS/PEP-CTERM-associated repeat-containing protein, partial [Ensifer sp. YR511]
MLACTALVAPLAPPFLTAPVLAQTLGGNGGNGGDAPNSFAPGLGGAAGLAGDGSTTGTGGGSGTIVGRTGGSGGDADLGGQGGGGDLSDLTIDAAGAGGGGAGGGGKVINSSQAVTSDVTGGAGGNGGSGQARQDKFGFFVGGGGGGGGGGSGIMLGSQPHLEVTIGAGVSVTGGQGGQGGSADVQPFFEGSLPTTANGYGGHGGHGISAFSSAGTTILNQGTIRGGDGGVGGVMNGAIYTIDGIAGRGGYGVAGGNLTIVNRGIIVGGTTPSGGTNTAISITGGVNSITTLAGGTTGAVVLGGGDTTLAGTLTDTLSIYGGAAASIGGATSDGDVTGITRLTNGGTLSIGAGRIISAGAIDNIGTIAIGDGAALQGTGNTLNNSGTIDVGAGGAVDDAGDINNFDGAIISFNGPTGTATLSSGTDNIINDGQIRVQGGGVAVSGNLTNRNSGTLLLSNGNMSGIGTLTNENNATINVSSGYTLGVDTLTVTGGNLIGEGAIDAATAFNLSSGTIGLTLSGDGALTKTGTGAIVLGGENTYTGGTMISAGTLQIGNGGTGGSVVGDVTNNGMLAFNRSDDVTFGDTVSGTGSLRKLGSGTLSLTGENTYSGGTVIMAGTLQIGAGGTSGWIAGNVDNYGAMAFNRSDDVTFSGIISGIGALSHLGDGTTTLTGTNSYNGGTTISAGTLRLGAGGSLWDFGDLTVEGGATFDLDGNDQGVGALSGSGTVALGSATLTVGNGDASSTFRGVIGGAGGLAKADSGTITLSGDNTYSGGTAISGGTLQIGEGGISGSIVGDVASDGTLVFNRSDDVTFGGTISGNGTVSQIGAGTLTLTGNNSYSGGTTINAGTLVVSSDANLGNASGGLTLDAGTLRFGRSFDLATTRAVALASDSTIDTNGFDTMLSQVVSGSGGLTKTGVGLLTLRGANTYSGGTTISSGMLAASSDANLGDVSGGLTLSNGYFQLGASFDLAATRAFAVNGYSTLDTNGFSTTLSQSISGNGDFNKDGAGTLTLAGDNSGFGGSFSANAGTVSVTGALNSTIGSVGGDNAEVVVSGSGATWTADTQIGLGGWGIDTTRLTITDGGIVRAPVVFAGHIGDASAIITVSGSGSVLQGDNEVIIGFNGEGDLVVADGGKVITDSLTIGQNGARGTLTLGAVAGDPAIAAGMLDTDFVNTGTNGRIVFNHTDPNYLFATDISGAGSVEVHSGTTAFTAINTYSGGTTISGGTLQLGDGGTTGSIEGDVTNDGTLAFNRSDDITFGGVISGVGGVTKLGGGTLTLTGENTYSGGTTISGGALVASSDANLGAASGGLVFNGGTLRLGASFDMADRAVTIATANILDTNGFSTRFSRGISGTGSLYKTGAGALTIAGDSSGFDGYLVAQDGSVNITGVIGGGAGQVDDGAEVTISGPDAAWSASGGLSVEGRLTVENGATVDTASFLVGGNSGSSGEVLITGVGSRWVNTTYFGVGGVGGGTGTLTIADRGELTSGGAAIYDGAIIVRKGASFSTSQDFYIGFYRDGALTIESGGTVNNNGQGAYLGAMGGGGTGTVIVTGTGSSWSGVGELGIGNDGAGNLRIENGGTVSSAIAFLGTDTGSGDVIVTGAGSHWTNSGSLYIGHNVGGGELTIADGGTVTADRMHVGFYGSGTLNIGAAAGDAATGAGGLDAPSVEVRNTSKIVFNHTGTGYDFGAAITGTGTINQIAGVTNLTGDTSSFTGDTNITGGTLRVNNTLGGAVSVTGGTLGGSGTLAGNVSVTNGAIAAGNSPGTLTIGGDLTLASGSSLNFELGNPSGVAGVDSDLINVGGNLTLDGTLNVTNAGGFGGGLYRLVNYNGSLTDNGLEIGSTPIGFVSSDLTVQTATANQVNLLVDAPFASFWDGANNSANSSVDGGSGTWSVTGNNWTFADGSINGIFDPSGLLIFSGTAGTVTVDDGTGAISTSVGMQFAADGYTITGKDIALTGATAFRVGDGTSAGAGFTATIASNLTGAGSLNKTDLGTLVLTGANSYTGGTTISAGTLIGNTASLQGDFVNNVALTFDQTSAGTYAGIISGIGSLTKSGAGALTLTGANAYTGGTTIS